MSDRESRASINHITLPGPIDRVASKYNTRNYADQLSSADRTTLNETDLFPYCF